MRRRIVCVVFLLLAEDFFGRGRVVDKPKDSNFHLITFTTANYDSHAKKLLETAAIGGFNKSAQYGPDVLDELYVQRNSNILSDGGEADTAI